MVRLLLCDWKVMGSSYGNSLFAKSKDEVVHKNDNPPILAQGYLAATFRL